MTWRSRCRILVIAMGTYVKIIRKNCWKPAVGVVYLRRNYLLIASAIYSDH